MLHTVVSNVQYVLMCVLFQELPARPPALQIATEQKYSENSSLFRKSGTSLALLSEQRGNSPDNFCNSATEARRRAIREASTFHTELVSNCGEEKR